MAVRERRVLEPCQTARVGAATGREGQVVETVRAGAWGVRGFHDAWGILLRHEWRANYGVVRHEWRANYGVVRHEWRDLA